MGHGKNKKRDSILKVLMTSKEFVIYVYQITSNDKQFSKSLRASLVQELRKKVLKIHMLLREANSIYPTTIEDYNKRRKKHKKRKLSKKTRKKLREKKYMRTKYQPDLSQYGDDGFIHLRRIDHIS